MSKGSKQRPGQGYGEGYDRIFGKKPEKCERCPINTPYGHAYCVGCTENYLEDEPKKENK